MKLNINEKCAGINENDSKPKTRWFLKKRNKRTNDVIVPNKNALSIWMNSWSHNFHYHCCTYCLSMSRCSILVPIRTHFNRIEIPVCCIVLTIQWHLIRNVKQKSYDFWCRVYSKWYDWIAIVIENSMTIDAPFKVQWMPDTFAFIFLRQMHWEIVQIFNQLTSYVIQCRWYNHDSWWCGYIPNRKRCQTI